MSALKINNVKEKTSMDGDNNKPTNIAAWWAVSKTSKTLAFKNGATSADGRGGGVLGTPILPEEEDCLNGY